MANQRVEPQPDVKFRPFMIVSGDVDFGNARIRLLLGTSVIIYLLLRSPNQTVFLSDTMAVNLLCIFYFFASLLLLLSNMLRPGPNVPRRIFAILLDTISVSYAMILGGETASPLYGGYLWATIGVGLRFGRKYLFLTNILSLIGFATVLYSTPYWHEEIVLGLGLCVWLVLLPIYVSALLKRLELALAHANHANAVKSQFLANMSHELRTPLNAVIGYSEMLEEDARAAHNTQTAQDLQNIKGAAYYLLDLINSVLDFSRLEAGKMQLDKTRFSIKQLIDEIAVAIMPMVEKKHNTLAVENTIHLDELESDRTKLKQSLLNLLSNANKFTDHGQIRLSITHDDQPTASNLVFRVCDTGIGIAPEKLQHIFEPFEQADSSTTRRFGGTGLGLSITRGFIEILGGTVHASSTPGQGSTFEVRIPLGSYSG